MAQPTAATLWFNGDGTTQSYTLPNLSSPPPPTVFYNGVLQSPTSYSILASVLTLSFIPQVGDMTAIVYFQTTPTTVVYGGGNSTMRLQDCLDYCQTFADLQSVIPASGYSQKKVFVTADSVMKKFLSSALKWNFNNRELPIGMTNSWQQDYATNLLDVGFVVRGRLLEINSTSLPRPIHDLEAVQGAIETSNQYGRPGQICAIKNKLLQYATWGASGIGTANLSNPQPSQTINTMVGVIVSPSNPLLQVVDGNGNFWILTTFGTTGSYGGSAPYFTQPPWPAYPVFPTSQAPYTAPTTLVDGTCVWTAVNPEAWGFRLGCLPPQTGVPYQIFPMYQKIPPKFNSLSQFLDPIPDDHYPAFIEGMIAVFYQGVNDPKIRAKHQDAVSLWEKALKDSKMAQDRTRDQATVFPGTSIMGGGDMYYPNVAFPYGS